MLRHVWAILLVSATDSAAQPAEAVLLAYRDIQRVAPYQRPYTRYLWISQDEPKLQWATWAAAAGHINFLSRSRRIVSPPVVLRSGEVRVWPNLGPGDYASLSLLRVCLLDYHISPEQWDKLANPAIEPIFHVLTKVPEYPAGEYTNGTKYPAGPMKQAVALAPWLIEPLGVQGPAIDERFRRAVVGLATETGYAQAPIIEARNFVWITSIQFDRQGAGYYDFLGVKDKKTFDKLVRLNEDIVPLREAVAESKVAQQPRRVERYGRGDGYWITYDQVNQRAQGNRNPLETIDDTFRFDASEVIAPLDNGLPAFLLADFKGVRQDSAPDGVGYNHGSITNDGKIHIYLTCIACHDKRAGNAILQPFTPYFRTLWAEPGPAALASTRFKTLKFFSELYLTPFDPPWASVDKTIYAGSLFQCNGLLPHQYATVLYETFHSWDAALDIEAAAREYGVTAASLQTAMQQQLLTYGALDNTNTNWTLPPQRRMKIGRDQFSQSYNLGQLALRGLPTWPDYLRQKYPAKK